MESPLFKDGSTGAGIFSDPVGVYFNKFGLLKEDGDAILPAPAGGSWLWIERLTVMDSWAPCDAVGGPWSWSGGGCMTNG